jgi:hypothetical protein
LWLNGTPATLRQLGVVFLETVSDTTASWLDALAQLLHVRLASGRHYFHAFAHFRDAFLAGAKDRRRAVPGTWPPYLLGLHILAKFLHIGLAHVMTLMLLR